MRRVLPPALAVLALVAVLAGCALPSQDQGGPAAADRAPERFTIVPDDYHVPYAGTAEDGRKFFLSEELFSARPGQHAVTSYVGLFLWNADGSFDEVRVDAVPRPKGLPPGQAGPAGSEKLVNARLAELGDYVLEPIEVEPFTEKIGGVTFGWKVDGTTAATPSTSSRVTSSPTTRRGTGSSTTPDEAARSPALATRHR